MRRYQVFLMALLPVLLFIPSPWSADMNQKIYLIPAGPVKRTALERLVVPLQEKFGFDVKIGEGMEDIRFSYNKKRNQYHSSLILRKIRDQASQDALKVLGIADEDLYVPSLNFVFGEADLDGSAAIISLARLKQEFYGGKPDDSLLEERTLKEAVHELGHCFGLHHCSDPKCVMHFSNSLRDTDIKSSQFCSFCLRKLEGKLSQFSQGGDDRR